LKEGHAIAKRDVERMMEEDRPTSAILIRPLAAEDAPKLARCFERCYGDSYVADFFYDPARIQSRLAEGRLRSVVAVDPSGDIVGHMGLTLRRPGALTADAGNTVVDPRARNQGLAARLGAGIFELCHEAGLVGFHHYPTTAHPIMQKLAVQGGGVETGVMLEYIPAGTRYRELVEGAAETRSAVVVVYQPLADAPARDVFPPERYAKTMTSLWERAGLRRSPRDPAASHAPGPTLLESIRDPRRGLLRLEVEIAGADLCERVTGAIRGAGVEVVQVDLRLSDSGVSVAVEALRPEGFFFCALLPEYRDGDVLRVQRLPDMPGGRALPELATAGGRELLDVIARDRAEALSDRRPIEAW